MHILVYLVQIYKITNKIDGKSYIGQTKGDFNYRYNDSGHWWISTRNIHLKRASEKYGHENFDVSILEDDIQTQEELNNLEIFYIKHYNTLSPNGYNFCPGGSGRKYTDEICDKISSTSRNNIPYKFRSPQGKLVTIENLSRFCRENNLSHSLMNNVFRGKRRKHKGWTNSTTILNEKKFISPSGEVFILIEGYFKEFCKKNKLHHGAMGDVWTEKYKQHKGWTKYKELC